MPRRNQGTTWAEACAFATALPGIEASAACVTAAPSVRCAFPARPSEDGEPLVVLVALPRAEPALVRELVEDGWPERAPKRAVQEWLPERAEAAR